MIFETVAQRMSDVREPLRLFSEFAIEKTERGFQSESDPEGKAWEPLNPEYAKKKKGPSILTEEGDLRGSIAFEVKGHAAIIGPDDSIIYHAAHQGLTDRNPRAGVSIGNGAFLPARPYVGATEQDAGIFGLMLLGHFRGLTDTTP